MNDLKYNYYIIKGFSDRDVTILDRVRKTIYARSEERRVGKECGSRGGPCD